MSPRKLSELFILLFMNQLHIDFQSLSCSLVHKFSRTFGINSFGIRKFTSITTNLVNILN